MENNDIEKQRDEYLNGWKRERADFINYKKEEAQRMKSMAKYAVEEIVAKILPILDNFNIAEEHLTKEQRSDSHVKGLFQIKQQMEELLKNCRIEEVKTEIGDKFDPNLHEVVGEVEGDEPDTISEIIRKGYIYDGHLLRPVKVKISK